MRVVMVPRFSLSRANIYLISVACHCLYVISDPIQTNGQRQESTCSSAAYISGYSQQHYYNFVEQLPEAFPVFWQAKHLVGCLVFILSLFLSLTQCLQSATFGNNPVASIKGFLGQAFVWSNIIETVHIHLVNIHQSNILSAKALSGGHLGFCCDLYSNCSWSNFFFFLMILK